MWGAGGVVSIQCRRGSHLCCGLTPPALGSSWSTLGEAYVHHQGQEGPGPPSYFVVDIGRTLGGHLLDDIDGVAIVSAHLLVVGAEGTVRSP